MELWSVHFVDPDGRYNCQNANGATCSEEEAKRMKAYVDALRAAHAKMKPGAAADRLGKILDKIGTLFDKNGVTLQFAKLKDGVLGQQVGSTLQIDEGQLIASAKEHLGSNPSWSHAQLSIAFAASTIGHEGSHLLDESTLKNGWAVYPNTRNERTLTEIRAYGVNSAVHNVLRINSVYNARGMSIKDRARGILDGANSSVNKACQRTNGSWPYGCY